MPRHSTTPPSLTHERPREGAPRAQSLGLGLTLTRTPPEGGAHGWGCSPNQHPDLLRRAGGCIAVPPAVSARPGPPPTQSGYAEREGGAGGIRTHDPLRYRGSSQRRRGRSPLKRCRPDFVLERGLSARPALSGNARRRRILEHERPREGALPGACDRFDAGVNSSALDLEGAGRPRPKPTTRGFVILVTRSGPGRA